MNKVLIVLMFILLGTSLIFLTSTNKGVENSFDIEYHNNKNLAYIDVTGKTQIVPGVYRLYNIYGVIIDYNIYNGTFTINGTASQTFAYQIYFNPTQKPYVLTQYYISGNNNNSNELLVVLYDENGSGVSPVIFIYNSSYIINDSSSTNFGLYISDTITYTNYQFKLQLEHGQTSTSYTVPKLIPVYKDNLSIEEKQEIGFGAFGGVTQIIKSINNVIKPINDFINGILNLF